MAFGLWPFKATRASKSTSSGDGGGSSSSKKAKSSAKSSRSSNSKVAKQPGADGQATPGTSSSEDEVAVVASATSGAPALAPAPAPAAAMKARQTAKQAATATAAAVAAAAATAAAAKQAAAAAAAAAAAEKLKINTAATQLQSVVRGKRARSKSPAWPVMQKRAEMRELFQHHDQQRMARLSAAQVIQRYVRRLRSERARGVRSPLKKQTKTIGWLTEAPSSWRELFGFGGTTDRRKDSTPPPQGPPPRLRDVAKQLDKRQAKAVDEDKLNPLSANYVGPEEHRRILESREGKFKRLGAPTQANVERALPGQVATLLNVLSFVDAVNELLIRRLVKMPGENSAVFEALTGWDDGALQARFSGAAQYLRAAKKYGLLHFDGEMPLGCVITSLSLGRSRHRLLAAVLMRPQLIGASMDGRELVRRVLGPEFEVQLERFVEGTFDDLFPRAKPKAVPGRPGSPNSTDLKC